MIFFLFFFHLNRIAILRGFTHTELKQSPLSVYQISYSFPLTTALNKRILMHTANNYAKCTVPFLNKTQIISRKK